MDRRKLVYIGILLLSIVLICSAYSSELSRWLSFGKENAPKERKEDVFKNPVFHDVKPQKWFPFNRENALKEWQEKVFRGRVLYAVKPRKEIGYLSAQSDQTCSGLVYHIRFDPRKFPMISWNWKVLKFPAKNEPPQKGKGKERGWIERDDYAARVYVIFLSWNFMNIHSLEYVWDENLPEETIISSPYFSNLKLIVVESGKKNMDDWVFEKRNIYNDYKKAFGRAPNRPVGAIALMTDSDNTVSTAEALYMDIKVGYKDE
ncbi:MAG TPA: DUF3047 domain-containing protein [Candidatus Omnitrophota bacterium]|nr:DUF3047 domain-containing protein [Candidatus Omnitrophota bacterium]HPD85487.1 DUF3047 domain-containing protein [Candidatus Omnitrophota bacterium]HRZ04012.1 DUF3047 domain-containing protein [Candidatus Omnitrophota bacterium]